MADKKLVAQTTIAKKLIASVERIESRMFLIRVRGQKIMRSMHLAELNQVEPRVLVRAVKCNTEALRELMTPLEPRKRRPSAAPWENK